MKRLFISAIAAVSAGILAPSAQASTFDVLLESDSDRPGGSEVFMGTFNTFDDLLTANSSGVFSQLNIGPDFSAEGLAYRDFSPAPAVVPLPASLPL